jgi:hypothetical protein
VPQFLQVEVLLPKVYNDKTQIEAKKYRITYQEIIRQFKGISRNKSAIEGYWIDPKTNKSYSDENVTFWFMCENTPTNVEFLTKFKETLKERFQQEDIMMYYTVVTKV